jgi:NADP-reducing hydrogenase subunit HndB
MAINNLEALKNLRKSFQNQVTLREKGVSTENSRIEILVGLGTCGIAVGAKDTYSKFVEVLKDKKLDNASIISVGCIGYCYVEPTVQINISGREPMIFGPINEHDVEELVEKVILKGELLESKFLPKSFNKVVI